MAVLSFATNKSVGEEDLPTLRETRARQGGQSRLIWKPWGLLAAIMLTIYLPFEITAWWIGSHS